jgi:hypothetical protein
VASPRATRPAASRSLPRGCLSAVGRLGMMTPMTEHPGDDHLEAPAAAAGPSKGPALGRDRRQPAAAGDPEGPAASGDPDGLAPASRHALEAFVAHLRDERGLSGHTVAAYRRDMTQFLQFAGRAGVTDPAQVEPVLLRRFLALQRTRGLAAASIAR